MSGLFGRAKAVRDSTNRADGRAAQDEPIFRAAIAKWLANHGSRHYHPSLPGRPGANLNVSRLRKSNRERDLSVRGKSRVHKNSHGSLRSLGP